MTRTRHIGGSGLTLLGAIFLPFLTTNAPAQSGKAPGKGQFGHDAGQSASLRSALRGQEEHKKFAERLDSTKPGEYRTEVVIYDRWKVTEAQKHQYRRLDAMTRDNRAIELKPRSESGIRRGEKQLAEYEKLTGAPGGWLVTYETRDGVTTYRWRQMKGKPGEASPGSHTSGGDSGNRRYEEDLAHDRAEQRTREEARRREDHRRVENRRIAESRRGR